MHLMSVWHKCLLWKWGGFFCGLSFICNEPIISRIIFLFTSTLSPCILLFSFYLNSLLLSHITHPTPFHTRIIQPPQCFQIQFIFFQIDWNNNWQKWSIWTFGLSLIHCDVYITFEFLNLNCKMNRGMCMHINIYWTNGNHSHVNHPSTIYGSLMINPTTSL